MNKKINILIVGVGGQGTLLASRVLGKMAELNNLECKLSEVHGMSQRGGSVVTHVRIGDNVMSPIITEGEADYILAFEKLEALRWCHYLKENGDIIVNEQEIMPMPVITGAQDYPTDVYEQLKKLGKGYTIIKGLELATEAGNSKAVNTVIIGALGALMAEPLDRILEAVRAVVPAKLVSVNERAASLGYAKGKELSR